MSTPTVARTADPRTNGPWFRAMARTAMVVRGAVFLAVALLAIAVAGDGGATGGGALAGVAQGILGEAVLVTLIIGLGAYSVWRLTQAYAGVRDAGDDGADWALRATKVVSGVAYGALFLWAEAVLHGSREGAAGSGQETRASVPVWEGGEVWLLLAGCVVFAAAPADIYRGLSAAFMSRLHPPRGLRSAVTTVGRVGICARGVVLWLASVLLISASIGHDPDDTTGLDGALARLAAQDHGPFLLGVVAVGLIAFALYCFAEARYREV